ncbi:GntR family transcriptional regulator [Microbacterium karelineae]|uniref:GntR family transcriptional regulator n=1 Tax=Microbacterium karelineae TaxID=2654283 RepID=UPI0018D2857D|nr:GntR family transcriptional regulator [Microbacterium karelineae]
MEKDVTEIQAQPKRLADIVYERLCNAIVDGSLKPGQRVRDGELADRLGVSRMPVREALQRLERQGLIEMVASRYTRVTEVTPEMPGQSLEFIGYQVGIGLRLAVRRLDEAGRKRAAEMLREIGAHAETDPKAAYDATRRFGEFLGTASENALFQATMTDAWLMLSRNLRGTFPLVKDAAAIRSELDEAAAAVEAGDAVAAEELVRRVMLLGPGQPGPASAVENLWDDAE